MGLWQGSRAKSPTPMPSQSPHTVPVLHNSEGLSSDFVAITGWMKSIATQGGRTALPCKGTGILTML
eukprot:Em0016g897a